MPSPKRIVLEKSRTVRRRYQRSNKRLEFSASQIARIEREEAREKRAKQLRDREKKRIANKKKKAEKEAAEREERRKRGPGGLLAEQCAEPVPSSQPLLSRFLTKKTTSAPVEAEGQGGEGDTTSALGEDVGDDEDEDEDTQGAGVESSRGSLERRESLGEFVELGEEDESFLACLDDLEDLEDMDGLSDDTIIAGLENGLLQDETRAMEDTGTGDIRKDPREKDDDEFSDCSIFYDEDLIKEADSMATTARQPRPKETSDKPVPIGLPVGDSFQDDTADLLEEFAHEIHEFDTDDEFERELVQLDAV
ncbi:uncharacterized protein LDX57_001020 [Aspergillus melleus]|uniref:uncharacterized protein n=1 Tax=Aspergillus melleus TaxID=138277 RepID=UPI001E8EC7DB|nr:uncharacterized protein LDX57_001020 [Aspergillus melleus]KAH8423261.1 hypothetical protein LDX57_001020 [Aspergillus melleus]